MNELVPHPSLAAERMRLHRERRRNGMRSLWIELRATKIDALVSVGLLQAETRAFGGRDTCELYKSIDVRRWHREGRLLAGRQFSWSWTSGGETSGTIKVRSEVDAVVLMYQAPKHGTLFLFADGAFQPVAAHGASAALAFERLSVEPSWDQLSV